MIRLAQLFSAALVGVLLAGCAQGPAAAERIKNLEARNAALSARNERLETDFRSAGTDRDQLRRQLSASESERQQLEQERDRLQMTSRDAEQLRQQVQLLQIEQTRLTEQLTSFRKGLRDLLGQAEQVPATAPTALIPPTIRPETIVGAGQS